MQPPEISYKTYELSRGTIENTVRGTGYFVYAEQSPASFKSLSGRLKSLPLKYGEIKTKGDIVAELETGDLDFRIAQQEIQVRKAEISLEKKRLVGADKFEMEIANLDLRSIQLQLDQYLKQRESSRLRSPITGEVVYIINLLEGDYVDTYRTITVIADRSKLLLSYNGSNMSEFKLGMDVNVEINKEIFSGRVYMTPAEFPYDALESQKQQILITIDDLPEDVEKGDAGSIYLILERKEDVLIVPRSQVQHYMGRKFVYVLEDGVRVERNIDTGIQNATEVEITEGLNEADLLVLR